MGKKPRKNRSKLGAVHTRSRLRPMLALFYHEVEAIVDNVFDNEMIDEFYDWLDDWDKFIFEKANFSVVDKKGKLSPLFMSYEIVGWRIKISLLTDDQDITFITDSRDFDIESGTGVSVTKAKKDWWRILPEDVIFPALAGSHQDIVAEYDELQRLTDQLLDDGEIGKIDLLRGEAILESLKHYPPEEREVIRQAEIANLKRGKREREEVIAKYDAFAKKFGMRIIESYVMIVLSSLFYFHIRIPKTYLKFGPNHSDGWKKYNDLYNPFKRLHPGTIVRPKNGTRSYLERNWTRRTESWHVKGHKRVYKSGKVVWIKPYVKGTGEGIRLSIYADEMGASDYEEE